MPVWDQGATAEDIAIAKVVLGGWQIERLEWPATQYRYRLRTPSGRDMGAFPTRYSAAMAAESAILVAEMDSKFASELGQRIIASWQT